MKPLLPAAAALSHLGIQLASSEDVLAMKEMWKEAGLSTHDEMQTNCCYAVQDKSWCAIPTATNGKLSLSCRIIWRNRVRVVALERNRCGITDTDFIAAN